mgnify:CR=1 FL=1
MEREHVPASGRHPPVPVHAPWPFLLCLPCTSLWFSAVGWQTASCHTERASELALPLVRRPACPPPPPTAAPLRTVRCSWCRRRCPKRKWISSSATSPPSSTCNSVPFAFALKCCTPVPTARNPAAHCGRSRACRQRRCLPVVHLTRGPPSQLPNACFLGSARPSPGSSNSLPFARLQVRPHVCRRVQGAGRAAARAVPQRRHLPALLPQVRRYCWGWWAGSCRAAGGHGVVRGRAGQGTTWGGTGRGGARAWSTDAVALLPCCCCTRSTLDDS